MPEPTDVEALVAQLTRGSNPENIKQWLDALLGGQTSPLLAQVATREPPRLRPIPKKVRGFCVRLDLRGAKPPVWRRLELPGDIRLPQLHDVIQAAMGWAGYHLHRFRTGNDYSSPYFITDMDADEGDEGLHEKDVRLDQVVAEEGDQLCYEYDFGDGWEHVLKVEAVLSEPPDLVRCTAGRLACPPEDCGGIGGYLELAAWVRSGYDDELVPGVFGDAAQAREWLPYDWHPDHFELAETNTAIVNAMAEPVSVSGELADLCGQLERRGVPVLRELLSRPESHGPAEVTADEAARLTESYRILLDLIGDGVTLTKAGYLPPALVEQFGRQSGIAEWWIGKVNREDLTPPVAQVRNTARALGLVSVRKGRLAPTAAGARVHHDPEALWRHIVGRLPLGTKENDRDAGWMALAVAGSGVPAQEWHSLISDLLFGLGWRTQGDLDSRPPAYSPTLDVLEELAGAARSGWRTTGGDPAVAASARVAVKAKADPSR